jgi:hypothetical protein
MLRLTHTQVAQGALLINDIDPRMAHKTAGHSLGDPKRYRRDGNSLSGPDASTRPDENWPKQKCYVPRVKAGDSSVAGYIDILESDAVLMSQARGTIKGLQTAGHLTVTSFLASDVVAPVLSTADLDTPGAGDLTLTGTGFTSLAPDITTVYLTGAVTITLTQAQIITGGGTVGATSIFIPAALIPGAVITTVSARVKADNQLSAVVVLT